MGQELNADHVSMAGAAGSMRDSADLFGQHTEALLTAISGDGRSPWGVGVIGMAMDHVNEMLGQACRHLQTNLGATGAGIQTMADRLTTTEHAVATAAEDLETSI
ncbi:hypothetical protein [Sphaerisporangium corydalis]|uniref:ESX-1 secretion-associated protein n=1 Tax=Sphaerisporangium corydalis TaxID=1441875 RepID=A0ABV9ERU6_9ACTN|nr:hypothetical protein [Sphaerisporangium corydalis]